MEPSVEEIIELRSSFLKKCEDENIISSGTFHPKDVQKAKTDDDWLRRFLMHNDNDQKEALNMLMETCDWRKKCAANDISERDVKPELLEGGNIFPFGKDKDGCSLLIFKSKSHVKGAHNFDDLKRHLVYWMERMERQEKGQMISIFFDMEGAGFSNMDMDYTKYIISLFKNYYPRFLNYIIIFEMPWILNAAFKMIKSWLPPKAIKKLKFLNKTNLKEIIHPENALKSWGGKSDFVYVHKFEEKEEEAVLANEENKKKVHFVDGSPMQDNTYENGFIDTITASSVRLTVSPSDFLPFSYEGNDLTGVITLKNDDVQCLSFKIKTTSPKKFRVRPSLGILCPDKSITVTVTLQHGYELPGLSRDKFLIMCLPVDTPEPTSDNLMELWKNASVEDISSYKLRCSLSNSLKSDGAVGNGIAFGTHSVDEQKITKLTCDMIKLQSTVSNLRDDVKMMQRQQWVIATAILFAGCIIAYVSGTQNGISNNGQSCWVMNETENIMPD